MGFEDKDWVYLVHGKIFTLENTEISTRISQNVGIWPAGDHHFPRNQLHGVK